MAYQLYNAEDVRIDPKIVWASGSVVNAYGE